ncbi:MAG: undecaprenyldiphospho-muramoylpentapeptide beta-N-acetylglucosaminyltransferase [Flavobacteriaceae bacterium]
MKLNRIIISGGGTGGHIFPALSIADALKEKHKQLEIRFVGGYGKMEMEKVPQAGYSISGIWIDGFQRKWSKRNLIFPLKLLVSLIQSLLYVLWYRPQIVVGTGGFASGPLLFIASLLGVPSLIQEQNSYPGITNRLLGKYVTKIAVSYPHMERYFPFKKIVLTGNPTRKGIGNKKINQKSAKAYFGLATNKKTIVILGGSLGAKRINELVAEKLLWFQSLGWQLIWQCGKLYYDQFQSMASSQSMVFPFVKDMDQLYAAADIFISRAGASTIAELTQVGKPVIFIPSPNVAEDHQMKNAMALVQHNAAIVIAETKLETEFATQFEALANDPIRQQVLGRNMRHLSYPNAVKVLVNNIENLVS